MIMVLTWVIGLRGGFNDQLWLQLGFCESAPEGFRHPDGRVLAEGSRDVGVALGLAELGVPEDLLYDADADASSSRVAAVWRASWTLASRRPAARMSARQSSQSSRESIGAPKGVQKKRSQSCQAAPAVRRSAACCRRCARSWSMSGAGSSTAASAGGRRHGGDLRYSPRRLDDPSWRGAWGTATAPARGHPGSAALGKRYASYTTHCAL